jgi:hypothetical protein
MWTVLLNLSTMGIYLGITTVTVIRSNQDPMPKQKQLTICTSSLTAGRSRENVAWAVLDLIGTIELYIDDDVCTLTIGVFT